MSRDVSIVHALCQRVLDSVVAYYDAEDAQLPARRLISAGPPAWECESLAVWVEATRPHEGDINASSPTSLAAAPGLMLRAATIGVTITRCSIDVAEIGEFSGEVTWPPAADVTANAERVHLDEPRVIEAVRIGARDGRLPNLNDWSVADWKVVGPLGGWVASEHKLIVSTDWHPEIPGS